MKKLLLHICCGPCAITTVEVLQDAGFAVTGLFYNPNIHGALEYQRRLDGARDVSARLNFPLITEQYDPLDYFKATTCQSVKNRCHFCYKLRLARLFSLGVEGGFKLATTSLLYSKYQKHEAIRSAAAALSATSGRHTEFLYMDFRSGWGRGIKLSKSWGIYRQQYCGCVYSEAARYGLSSREGDCDDGGAIGNGGGKGREGRKNGEEAAV